MTAKIRIYLLTSTEEIYKVLLQSAIGKVIVYTVRLLHHLVRYIADGRFRIDNNHIENTIHPVALGRKKYLFAGSHDAPQHAAIIYSLLASCKINDIEAFKLLKETFVKIPDYSANQLHRFLSGQK